MALSSATKLGPYEILSPLGAGGMGEVYRASDTRLDRTVAIKVLPESLANNADRLRRFEQEARVLSAMNHPNLLAIYDVGAQDGTHYLVSEYLEGQTLREFMSSGPLSSRKASEYALQIASGLAAAHEKGIVHRDLKPENIFVTQDDRVKILDFGLAKQSQNLTGLAGETATLTSPAATTAGTVMGTVGYMSPEQVRGQVVDSRSDIFSLGAILYEMTTGKRAFKGDSGVETMNAILNEDPPEIDAAQIKASPALERIIRHCLEKNPANRFQSARDLSFALSALSGTGSTSTVAASQIPDKRRWALWASAGIGLALVAGIVALLLLRQVAPQTVRLEFAIPLQQETGHLAISPDGRMLAFVSPDQTTGANMISVMRVGASGPTVLAGTEGATYPFWSPDDAYVAFFADGKLKKIATSGGIPQTITSAPIGRGGSWGRQGILFAPNASGSLWRVNPDGSGLAAVDTIFDVNKESSHRWPFLLPDGDHFLFLAGTFTNSSQSGIYLSSLSHKERKLVVWSDSNPGYANGYLFYLDDKRSLRAVRMDDQGNISGDAHLIADQIGFQPSTYYGAFSVAENGTVVYNPTVGASQSELIWYSRAGKELGSVGNVGVLASPSLSFDGTRVAVDVADSKANSVNVWISDFKAGTMSPFTFDQAEDNDAVWSRDGNWIAYRTTKDTLSRIYSKQVRGVAGPKLIFDTNSIGYNAGRLGDIVPNSWSSDDKEILCTFQPVTGDSNLVLIPAAGGKMTPFLGGNADETNGQISPDGKWVAYASDESGDWEVYVTTFPNAAGKWQVSRGGGTEPRWRGDGKEIFYIGPQATITAVPVNTAGGFSSGNPTPLFHTQFRAVVSSTDLFSYDVSKDGQRFLVNRYAKPAQIIPLRIILNSTAGFRR
jgi:eukaryotic-like serine/threonine-protein kinase